MIHKPHSFSLRFGLLLAGVGILLACLTAILPLILSVNIVHADVINRTTDRTNLASNILNSEASGLQVLAESLSRQLHASNLAADADYSKALGVAIKGRPTNELLEVVAPSGHTVVLGGAGATVHNNVAPSGIGEVLLDSQGHPWLSGTSSSLPQVSISDPLTPTILQNLIQEIGSSQNGLGIYLNNNRLLGQLPIASNSTDFQTFIKSSASTQEAQGSSGTVVMGKTLLTPGLFIITTTPLPSLIQVLGTAAPSTVLIAIALILFGLIAVYSLVERDLARPLRRLDLAVGGMAQGNFKEPIPVAGASEIARLGQNFQEMRQKLSDSLESSAIRMRITSSFTERPVNDALQDVCHELQKITNADCVFIATGSPDEPQLFFAVQTGTNLPEDPTAPVKGIVGAAFKTATGWPLPSIVLHATPLPKGAAPQLHSQLLQWQGKNLGVLCLTGAVERMTSIQSEIVNSAVEQLILALEKARYFQEATERATHDSLTGLYNRRIFNDFLAEQAALSNRTKACLSVLMLDIDHFKALNDSHGHLVGDIALTSVASIIRGAVRRADFVARYGGEEFVVIMPRATRADAKILAERIRSAIASSQIVVEKLDSPLSLTVSIGGATWPDDMESPESLVAIADSCLLLAKKRGRNQCVFPPEPKAQDGTYHAVGQRQSRS